MGRVFQFSKFKMAESQEAIQFLEEFDPTHLASYDAAAAIKTVRGAPVPKTRVAPRVMRSPATAIYAQSIAPDDLSERICAGFWALRRAGVRAARGSQAKL